MRLVDYERMQWQNRAHFFAASAQVVEMRFFGGLNVDETADVLKVSAATVMRDWSTAKAWLYRELAGGKRDAPGTVETGR